MLLLLVFDQHLGHRDPTPSPMSTSINATLKKKGFSNSTLQAPRGANVRRSIEYGLLYVYGTVINPGI